MYCSYCGRDGVTSLYGVKTIYDRDNFHVFQPNACRDCVASVKEKRSRKLRKRVLRSSLSCAKDDSHHEQIKHCYWILKAVAEGNYDIREALWFHNELANFTYDPDEPSKFDRMMW